jgi:hypothetical protein
VGFLVSNRSYSINATVDYREGDQGVIYAHGDQGGMCCTSKTASSPMNTTPTAS